MPRFFRGHDDAVRCLAVSEDDVLYTGSNDEQILAWDIDTQQPIRAFCGHTAAVSCLCCTVQEGRTVIYSGSFDQSIRAWDASTGECTQTFSGHSDKVASAAFSPDSSLLATGSADSKVVS